MDAIRIYPLNHLPHSMQNILREGQQEAAKVWNLCKDMHQAARSSQTHWPNRDTLQKARKGQFALHSQSVQMVVHAFLGAVDSIKERKPANPGIRYPYKEKRFYPLLWPAPAVAVSEKRIILPVGRGRKSVVLSRPEGFPDDGGAGKIVWNGIGYELHVVVHAPEVAARSRTPGLMDCRTSQEDGAGVRIPSEARPLQRIGSLIHLVFDIQGHVVCRSLEVQGFAAIAIHCCVHKLTMIYIGG